MNRYGMFMLVVCVLSAAFTVGIPGALAHGDENHTQPEKVVPSRDPSVKVSPDSGTSFKADENGTRTSKTGGHHRQNAGKSTSLNEKQERVRAIVDSQDRGTVWKITGFALFNLGLIIAYWPRGGEGETS